MRRQIILKRSKRAENKARLFFDKIRLVESEVKEVKEVKEEDTKIEQNIVKEPRITIITLDTQDPILFKISSHVYTQLQYTNKRWWYVGDNVGDNKIEGTHNFKNIHSLIKAWTEDTTQYIYLMTNGEYIPSDTLTNLVEISKKNDTIAVFQDKQKVYNFRSNTSFVRHEITDSGVLLSGGYFPTNRLQTLKGMEKLMCKVQSSSVLLTKTLEPSNISNRTKDNYYINLPEEIKSLISLL